MSRVCVCVCVLVVHLYLKRIMWVRVEVVRCGWVFTYVKYTLTGRLHDCKDSYRMFSTIL